MLRFSDNRITLLRFNENVLNRFILEKYLSHFEANKTENLSKKFMIIVFRVASQKQEHSFFLNSNNFVPDIAEG